MRFCDFPKITTIIFFILMVAMLRAEDWPEWRGKGRLGVWNESGIMEKFPERGLTFDWRVPIHGGYAGPAVAEGRVFVTDFVPAQSYGVQGVERAICLEEKTGKILWTVQWDVNYGSLSYNFGPRATPTVDEDRVYTLGAMGLLQCLNAKTGEIIWKKDYVVDYGTQVPTWGMTAAPLVEGDKLICLVGGANNAKVMAFDKMSGKEIWRALSSDSEPGYVQPILIESGGARQLIIWHPTALSSLNPVNGSVYWEQPFAIKMNAPLATPVRDGSKLFVSAFYNGPMMMELDGSKPAAQLLWKGKSNSEIKTDGLHCCHSTPAIKDGYIYGVCSYGQFRCLNAQTGERVWESMEITKENKRWASAFIVRHEDKFFLNNDRGELIIADLKPDGYHEISRTKLIDPTTGSAGKRDLEFVNWTHPAYANKHLVTRNDKEIIRASLEK